MPTDLPTYIHGSRPTPELRNGSVKVGMAGNWKQIWERIAKMTDFLAKTGLFRAPTADIAEPTSHNDGCTKLGGEILQDCHANRLPANFQFGIMPAAAVFVILTYEKTPKNPKDFEPQTSKNQQDYGQRKPEKAREKTGMIQTSARWLHTHFEWLRHHHGSVSVALKTRAHARG